MRAISAKSSALAPYLKRVSIWLRERTVNLLVHILLSSIPKVLSVPGSVVLATSLLHDLGRQAHWTWSVRPDTLDRTRTHLLKTDDKDTIDSIVSDQSSGKVKTSRSSSTSIVGVVNGD